MIEVLSMWNLSPEVVCLEVGGVVSWQCSVGENALDAVSMSVFATRLMSCLTAFHSTNRSLFLLTMTMFCLLFAQFCWHIQKKTLSTVDKEDNPYRICRRAVFQSQIIKSHYIILHYIILSLSFYFYYYYFFEM